MRVTSRVLLACCLFFGCAEEREAINRVQPNVVEKSILEGEWYYMETVIDSPYSAEFTVVGEQNYAERIRWEIQEEYLLARRTYEWIAGAEPEGIAGGSEQGTAVAMWKIDSHFDIRREYNSTTGEELNIIIEDDEDRAWFDREYMRVDWSENLIGDADVLEWARLDYGVEARSVAYYVQDLEEQHPHRPKFVRHPETGETHYIDVVNRIFVQPTTVEMEWWGEVPTCWLWEAMHLDCVGAEITVRHSFLRIDDDERDYQPWDFSGDRMERFGYFVTERAGYDPHYGVVDPVRYRFINRHNMWRTSHRRSEDGEVVPCSEDADCDDGEGSYCDLDWAKAWRRAEGACTVPYRQRQIRPIVYHFSSNFPEELMGDMEHVREEWNEAFVDTIGSLRELECLRLGGGESDCAEEREREDSQTVLVVCHNPVTEDDHEACGPEGTSAELGDLRFSLLGWVSDAHYSPPLGYGPAAVDPVTGEHVQASVLVYAPQVEWYAAYARDLMALLNGDLSEDEVASGLNVQRVAEHLDRQERGGRERSAHDHVIPLDGHDSHRVNEAMDFSWARRPGGPAKAHRRPSGIREALEWRDASRRRLSHDGGFGHGAAGGYALLEQLRGTRIEALLTRPEMQSAAGFDPRLPLDDTILAGASPLRGGGLAWARTRREIERNLHGNRCWYRADFADEGLLGLARAIQRAVDGGDGTMEWYGVSYQIRGDDGSLDYELVREMLRHPIFESTMSHELGHTLGLRHNFMGSYDALNYHPEYWELRDDGHMAPRAWDPITEEELDGRIREYQTSSVMDYGNNFVSTDAMGLGRYDIAAIKMGYGDLVEVFTNADDSHEIAWINFMQIWQYPVTLREESFEDDGEVSAYEYTELPEVLGGIERLEQRADVPYDELVPDESLASEGIDIPLVDGDGRPAVPYRFCSDEVADLDPTCMVYDAGADPYEVVQSVIDTYWNYYIFNNFRRERLGFEVDPYYWRVLDRYLWKLQWSNQSYVLYRSDFEDMFGDWLEDFMERSDGMGAWTLGIGAAYSLMTRIITAPEPGDYVLYEQSDGSGAYQLDEFYEADYVVDAYEGRYLETEWDWDQGYYWFDNLERVGYFYDKAMALQILVDPETAFVGEDTASDVRAYSLSFYNTFGPSLTSFLGSLMSFDWWYIGARPGDDGMLIYPDPLDIETGDFEEYPIDPNAGFTIQLYAAAFSMAMIPQSFSQEYIHQSRIFVLGGAEAVDVDEEFLVMFYEPLSGMTYAAASFPDEEGYETGVAARMLLHAQALADAWEAAEDEWEAEYIERELIQYIDTLDVMRSLSWQFGFGL